MKEKFPDHEFITAADENVSDVWLVVCGCLRACASTEGLKARRKLFVLSTERSFKEVQAYLSCEQEKKTKTRKCKEKMDVAKMQQKSASSSRRVLRVGQEAVFTKTLFKDDVDKFAALTGDYSRLHTDVEFAKSSIYGQPVVHGMLVASLISTVMGMELPGEGTVFVEEEVRFLKPVFYGDTVTAKVRLISCREGMAQYVGTFSGICVNQNGDIVVSAKCRQLMTKDLYEIENPKDTAGVLEAI
ncbi:MAG: MaoC family dehydratase [Lachnospiraceae bacterium]|nr:MaoC family dehydratase [Lachnospiraceae bacterium]